MNSNRVDFAISSLLFFPGGTNPIVLDISKQDRPARSKRCNLNPFQNIPKLLRVSSTSLLENTVGKGEIARNDQFLLFLQCFQPIWITFCLFHFNLHLSSANTFSLEESKICRLGKG